MCGVAGYFSHEGHFSPGELINMTLCLNHRGPDASDYYYNDTVGLGNSRLSILDLSTQANQPMHSHSNRYVIVYNGEVYNFNEIAAELNLKFRTRCDTEVILEAFAEWGVTFVKKLNGMFAIAIYDKEEDRLYLFRDRMGVKPLFYFWDGVNFAFASELKSILKLNFINSKKQIYKRAINEFLYLGFIPSPHTIYQNIFKFPSGHFARISNKILKIEAYWSVEDNIRTSLITNENEALEQLEFLLRKSVKYRLISDVPYGTFLSGGTDSSLVTAIAQQESTTQLKTFSIGFEEEKFNESGYAQRIAQYLNTDHHQLIVNEKDAMSLFESMVTAFDEPFGDSSAIPTMMVSKLAKKNVTMTLSGDGGDELFHGYGSYLWASRLSNPLIRGLRKPIQLGLSKMSNLKYQRASSLFNLPSRFQFKSHIFSQEQYFFTRSELDKLISDEYLTFVSLDEDYNYVSRLLTPAEAQALFDIKYYLKDDLLVKVDRASMKYSLETRLPLLDYHLVEFALNLSPELKIKGGVQKYLLKQLLYKIFPKDMFNRPKWGFSVPLTKWLKGDLNFLLNEALSRENVIKYNFVNYNQVEFLKKEFASGKDYLYNRLWLLIILHKWFELGFSENSELIHNDISNLIKIN